MHEIKDFGVARMVAASGHRRIALFQAYWPLHASTAYAARMLAASGYEVDVFLFEVDESLSEGEAFRHERIFIHRFGSTDDLAKASEATLRYAQAMIKRPFWLRAYDYLNFLRQRYVAKLSDFVRFSSAFRNSPFAKRLIERSCDILKGQDYVAFMGIEKGGLAWAGEIAFRKNVPLIYSSLELYLRDGWFPKASHRNGQLKKAEEKYHKMCYATIVQDAERGRLLLEDNGVGKEMTMLYLPISRWGEPLRSNHGWLRERLHLPGDQKLILSHGKICRERLSLEIATIAQRFEDCWTLVFHGYASPTTVSDIKGIDRAHKVGFSLELVEKSLEPVVMSSADICLVLYGNEVENDVLTGFSSEKLALALQCGVPIIAFHYPGYRHVEEMGCGILIKNLTDLPSAISKILNDHSAFKANAFATYEKLYRFETNFIPLLSAFDEICRRSPIR